MGTCVNSIPVSDYKTSIFSAVKRFFFRKKPTIAIIRMSGVVGRNKFGGIAFETYEPMISKAFELPGCKAVIMIVNSPGGAPAQCEMIADQIVRLSKEKSIPVYSFAEDVAASAGYWILLAGDEIYATASSIVGSIGVMYAGFGFSEIMKKAGVERRTYYEGKHKVILDSFRPENEEDVTILKELQHDMYQQFKDYVISRRMDKLSHKDKDEIFSGLFWTGSMAMELGLVDGISNYNRFIAEKFGNDAKIVHMKRQTPWWSRGLSLRINCDDIFGKIKEMISFPDF